MLYLIQDSSELKHDITIYKIFFSPIYVISFFNTTNLLQLLGFPFNTHFIIFYWQILKHKVSLLEASKTELQEALQECRISHEHLKQRAIDAQVGIMLMSIWIFAHAYIFLEMKEMLLVLSILIYLILLQVEKDRLVMLVESIRNGNPIDEINDKSDKVEFLIILNFLSDQHFHGLLSLDCSFFLVWRNYFLRILIWWKVMSLRFKN